MIYIPLILAIMSTGSIANVQNSDYLYSVPVTAEVIAQCNYDLYQGDTHYMLNQYTTLNMICYFNSTQDFYLDITSIKLDVVWYSDSGAVVNQYTNTMPVSDFEVTSSDNVLTLNSTINSSLNVISYEYSFYGETASCNMPLLVEQELVDYYVFYDYSYVMPFSHLFIESLPRAISSLLYNDGTYSVGYEVGKNDGYQQGLTDGRQGGYQQGYADGYTEGASQDETAVVIFTGILNVALLPINMFLQIFNFEVFGINIGGLVSAFLTVAIVVIIIRIITGKKSE